MHGHFLAALSSELPPGLGHAILAGAEVSEDRGESLGRRDRHTEATRTDRPALGALRLGVNGALERSWHLETESNGGVEAWAPPNGSRRPPRSGG